MICTKENTVLVGMGRSGRLFPAQRDRGKLDTDAALSTSQKKPRSSAPPLQHCCGLDDSIPKTSITKTPPAPWRRVHRTEGREL